MYKVGLISLGCAKNLVDSEAILGMLSKSDFTLVNTIDEADVIIVNTCGFIESSKQESIDNILDVVQYHKKVVVVGCLVERYLKDLQNAIPEVDLYVPIRDYFRLNKLIKDMLEYDKDIVKFDVSNRVLSTPKYQAYLRISDGCNNCCTYCAIPLIRGSFKSRPYDEIVSEALSLKAKGIKELVVISQDTTKFGSDLEPKATIVDLLKTLTNIGFYSIRLLYLYPDEITDELIDFIKDHKEVVLPYFDIPLQHASNTILKSMNRRGTKEEYINLINKIRNKIPEAILRTTYIVGFPGENEEDFTTLLDFTKLIKFDHLGTFKYSKEDQTKSYHFDNQIEEDVKEKRYSIIMNAQKTISYENNKKHIGEVMEGIVIGFDGPRNEYYLRSYWNAPDDIDGRIAFKSRNPLNNGDIVKVKITNAFVYDLFGEIIE